MSIPQIITLVLTLAAAVALVTELLRPDLVALVVMIVLGITSVVTPEQTFAGFSGSAVMTILGVSIISEGLRQTGAAQRLGKLMHRLGKTSETRLIVIVTLTSATVSLFMNNIAAVGVLLPAVMALSRKSGVPSSRLLLPLAYGTTLGGMATLLTTSNIIVSGTLKDGGFTPFGLLDFLPVGIPIVVIGTIYLATIGRKLLPGKP
ncbi:MAG: SLC13 family permease, partial [Anaerolineaceae bacterium]|nr:SLC13 family permease [Anaerolineaceae bacterium]